MPRPELEQELEGIRYQLSGYHKFMNDPKNGYSLKEKTAKKAEIERNARPLLYKMALLKRAINEDSNISIKEIDKQAGDWTKTGVLDYIARRHDRYDTMINFSGGNPSINNPEAVVTMNENINSLLSWMDEYKGNEKYLKDFEKTDEAKKLKGKKLFDAKTRYIETRRAEDEFKRLNEELPEEKKLIGEKFEAGKEQYVSLWHINQAMKEVKYGYGLKPEKLFDLTQKGAKTKEELKIAAERQKMMDDWEAAVEKHSIGISSDKTKGVSRSYFYLMDYSGTPEAIKKNEEIKNKLNSDDPKVRGAQRYELYKKAVDTILSLDDELLSPKNEAEAAKAWKENYPKFWLAFECEHLIAGMKSEVNVPDDIIKAVKHKSALYQQNLSNYVDKFKNDANPDISKVEYVKEVGFENVFKAMASDFPHSIDRKDTNVLITAINADNKDKALKNDVHEIPDPEKYNGIKIGDRLEIINPDLKGPEAVKPNVKPAQKISNNQIIQEDNMPRDFQLFLYEAERLSILISKARVGDNNGNDLWESAKKSVAPLRDALTKISKQDDLQSIDVDSLYDVYQKAVSAMDVAVKQAPQTQEVKRCESYINNAFSKEELKTSADAYISDFKNPVDVDKLVKPNNPLKYSEDPVQRKMQQAALKLAFWNKYKNHYTHDDTEEVINKRYDECAKAIENGTDENMLALNRIDKSKVETICNIVLSKGSVSSLIDFRDYIPDNEHLRNARLNTQKAFDTFFNPKANVGPNDFYQVPLESSQAIVDDANKKINSIELTVPEGLEDNDVAMLTTAELLSDKVMSETFDEAKKRPGSSIGLGAESIGGGRTFLTVNLLDGDERANTQYMRYGIADARAKAKEVLEQYKSGNKQPMADVLLNSLVQNAKYQKAFIRVDDKAGSFYSKCISDTIKLLDSDKFKDLVEIPQEVRDIDKLNKAHIKMTEEAIELKSQLNDYCLSKLQNGSTQNPKDDPEFVNLYSKWYARTSHLDMVNSMAELKRHSGGFLTKDNEAMGKNREFTAFEKRVIENADEYMSLREKSFLDSNAKKQLFEKDYKSWKDVLSNKITITSNAKVEPVTFDLLDDNCTVRMKAMIESIDENKYPGVKDKLLSRAPLDGTKLSRNASQAELDFRAKQYDDFLNYYDSLNLDKMPALFPDPVKDESGLRGDLEFGILQYKKNIAKVNKTLADARNFEKAIGAFEKESNALQELQAAKIKEEAARKAEEKQIALFTEEITRLSGRINKTHSDKQKNSISYKGLQYMLSECASKTKDIKTTNDLKGIVKFLNQSADDYLEDHANDKMGFFKSCGKARQERIKTCARIKTIKELLDKGIAYDSPEGKKAMLACKLVCAEKLERGFNGFKELCQPGAIKEAIDAKLKDPAFNKVADKVLENSEDYDKLTKTSGSKCLKAFNKAKTAVEKTNGIEKNQVKEPVQNDVMKK